MKSSLRFLGLRLLGLLLTLWVIVTISFFIIRLAPGGPFDREQPLPEQTIRALEKKYHLDEPLFIQYLSYLSGVIRGDLGPSMRYERSVRYYISLGLPVSLFLGSCALLLALLFGVGSGIMAALKQNRWQDYVTISISSLGLALPLFVVGPVLMYFLALKLQWLPTSGWVTGRHGWWTLVMPVITLSLPYLASIARLTRASAIDVLQSDYIRTALAKGLAQHTIVLRHMLKGTLLPVVSYCAPAFAGIVTGSVVVESIFSVPGLGRFLIQASFGRDYPMVMGMVIVYSCILILMNFIADFVYTLLDPRISYH